MPDLLIFSHDKDAALSLEQLGNYSGFRVKVALDFITVCQWLKVKPFKVIFVDAGLSVQQQYTLGDLLWEGDPLASMAVFDLDPHSKRNEMTARLFGAELALGKGAITVLTNCLEAAKSMPVKAISTERILVVEDLDAPRDIICSYIEMLGFPNVIGTYSAEEALERLHHEPKEFACILTDINMPKVSGEELIKRIRTDAPLKHLPIVVLTAYQSAETLIGCLSAGATGFLVKPPKRKDLMHEIARAIRIFRRGGNPSLATSADIEDLREALASRGIC